MKPSEWMGEGLRILDFDTENRPLTYLGSDFTTGDITAIAAGFVGHPRKDIQCWCLGVECQHGDCKEYHHGVSSEQMLSDFHVMYDEAEMVTGHYLLGYDLSVVNGAMLEFGLPPLADKLVQDTKVHLKKRKYLSVSQESLGDTLGLKAPKIQMNQHKWREANRLTPEGLAMTKKRVVGDVVQHMALRKRLLELGWLNPPQMWSSSGSLEPVYAP